MMHSYIIGNVTNKNNNSLVLENYGIGYFIFMKNTEDIQIDKNLRLYLYKNTSKDMQEELYGFQDWEEKKMFLDFLTVPGVGPKTAISLLNKLQINVLRTAIATEDSDFLQKFGVSTKVSKVLCSELSNKYREFKDINSSKMIELISALEVLGYSQKKVNIAIRTIDDYKKDISTLVSEAMDSINLIYNHE